MSLHVDFLLRVKMLLTKSADLSTPTDDVTLDIRDATVNGSGAGQADKHWHDQRTISASSNDDLDLAGGLTDALGQACTFAEIRGMIVRNRSTSGAVSIGGTTAASNAWVAWVTGTAPAVVVPAGGTVILWVPTGTAWAVTAGTADILRIGNPGGAAVTYDIYLIGR
jgi:hypothetical protein